MCVRKPTETCFLQSDADNALKGLTVESERGPQITITILDEDKVLTVKEAGDMGIREFARYYSVRLLLYLFVHISELDACNIDKAIMHQEPIPRHFVLQLVHMLHHYRHPCLKDSFDCVLCIQLFVMSKAHTAATMLDVNKNMYPGPHATHAALHHHSCLRFVAL